MESSKPKHDSDEYLKNQKEIIGLISSYLSQLNDAIRNKENRNDKEEKSPKIDKPNRPEKWVARGTIALVLVTAVLAWYTYKLFDEASSSGKLAKEIHQSDSALAEKRFESDTSALGAQISNAENTYQLQKEVYKKENISREISDSISKENLKSAQQTLKQQQQILDETKKEFKTINTPYFAANHFTVNMIIGKKPTVTFDISNLGIATQKIIRGNAVLFPGQKIIKAPDKTNNRYDSVLNKIPFENRYVAKDNPEHITIPTGWVLTQDMFDQIQRGDAYLYVYGFLVYVNEETKEERVYKFYIRFYTPSEGGYFMITNENKSF